MRILHLLNDIRDFGNGIINVAIDLACLQAKSGYTVGVASAGGSYETLLAHYGVQHFELNQRRSLQLLRAARRYRAIVNDFQPDIVHAHMVTGVLLARLLRGFNRYTLVSTVHNEFQRSANLMAVADRVIAVSQAVAGSMIDRGIPSHKLQVVCNGTIGSPRGQQTDAIALPLHRPAITSVAGMTHRKGIADLIDAFVLVATRFPTAHLYLVGEGPDRADFEHYAAATPVRDRIHFEGFQPHPVRYLKSTDVFVLASRQEPFGLVLAEAREAGCAIVATEVGGIPEVLNYGAAGILIPPQNSDAIAAALTNLLHHPHLLQTWQKQAQQNLEWLSAARMHQQTLAVYEQRQDDSRGQKDEGGRIKRDRVPI